VMREAGITEGEARPLLAPQVRETKGDSLLFTKGCASLHLR
jgi:hypothetical protein